MEEKLQVILKKSKQVSSPLWEEQQLCDLLLVASKMENYSEKKKEIFDFVFSVYDYRKTMKYNLEKNDYELTKFLYPLYYQINCEQEKND